MSNTDQGTVWGTWRGRYSYDSSAQMSVPPGVFTLRLERGWWFGRVIGCCIDHDPLVSSEPSRIRGWVKGNALQFEKRYRSNWVAAPDGPKKLREWLADLGLPTDAELPAHRVFYVGTFDVLAGIAKGTWRLTQPETLIFANGEDFIVPAGEASGTWTMKKYDDEV